MYGFHVHKAVIDSGDSESGISIHEVNEKYDDGGMIFQHSCPVLSDDTPESLALRVQQLEHKYYPLVVFEELEKLQQTVSQPIDNPYDN